jgi:tetratricopeptide (TPR) repeat protein
MKGSSRARVGTIVLIVAAAGIAYAVRPRPAASTAALQPLPLGRTTSLDDMARTVDVARLRLKANPADAEAGVALADVLMRQGRVERHGAHGREAEMVLRAVLREEPDNYTVIKMLGVTLLAQHRFEDAVDAASKAIALRKEDAWNYGVLGDAQLELGNYDAAFDAFDTMARIRPDAAAYARVAYAQELQGRLDEALRTMKRATEATGAQDPESLAWHYAQLAHLHFERGDLEAAFREYARADYVFPGHPYAKAGLARVAAARKNYGAAIQQYQELFVTGKTPDVATSIGDLLSLTGDEAGAAAMYAKAEALERAGWEAEAAQPGALARMLAERGLKTAEAVALAEQAASRRADIFTMDALAVAYWRAGRLDEAAMAASRALRLGSRDRRLLYHAAAIAHARGRHDEARRVISGLVKETAVLDPAILRGVEALSQQLGV